jgi:hypothetical protein
MNTDQTRMKTRRHWATKPRLISSADPCLIRVHPWLGLLFSDSLQGVIGHAVERFSRVDTLIDNAGELFVECGFAQV